jgi:hypothetical protein
MDLPYTKPFTWTNADGSKRFSQDVTRTEQGLELGAFSVMAVQVSAENAAARESAKQGRLITQATEWLKHEAALLTQGPVSREVHAHRYACCTGLTIEGKQVSPACPSFKGEAGSCPPVAGICESCGCGDRERARISPPGVEGGGVKLWCPTYSCPRKHWGTAEATGRENLAEFTGAGTVGQVTGVIKAAGAEVWKRLMGSRLD